MSMRELINASLGIRLHRWEPLTRQPPGLVPRTIYLEDKLNQQVLDADSGDARLGLLWSDFDFFSHGRLMTVGRGRESTCRAKCLEPLEDEVWELRCKDPEPQIRVFGRFAEKDVFVATHAEYRSLLGNMGGSKFDDTDNWPAEITRCKTIWNQLFQYEKPFSGADVNEYLSHALEVGRLA